MTELELLEEADRRARSYLADPASRRVFPGDAAIAGLEAFDEAVPGEGQSADSTLRLLDEAGSPATVASNGPNYYGFVIGALLPAAAAAERLAIAWDQCASSFANSPAVDHIEKVAARWILEMLRPAARVGRRVRDVGVGLRAGVPDRRPPHVAGAAGLGLRRQGTRRRARRFGSWYRKRCTLPC